MGIGPIPSATIARYTQDWNASEARVFRECMRRADAAFREAVGKQQDGTAPPPPSKTMSPEMFDAMFG